ncbi:AAA domain protein [compost metagenome]
MTKKGNSATAKMDTMKLKPSDASIAIKHMIETNMDNAAMGKDRRGLFLWGPPGIAKSSIVRQICKAINFKLIDVRLTQMEPTDLRGIPVPVKQDDGSVLVNWAIPAMLPRRDAGKRTGTILKDEVDRADENDLTYDGAIILLDELPNAAPSVQAGSYQLVLDGALGEYVAPSNVIIMAAGNRDTDKGSTFKMPTPLMNRFVHIEVEANFEDWQTYALTANFNKDVIGYLTAFKHELFQFDPSSASRGFPTPRSWEAVSDVVRKGNALPEIVKTALIGGAIGDGIAVKFLAYQKLASQLPNPSDILEGKVTELKSKDISLMYALTTAMCYELRDRAAEAQADKSKKKMFDNSFDNFLGFMMTQFQPEIVIMGARTALSVFRLKLDPTAMKNFEQFADEYQDLILQA